MEILCETVFCECKFPEVESPVVQEIVENCFVLIFKGYKVGRLVLSFKDLSNSPCKVRYNKGLWTAVSRTESPWISALSLEGRMNAALKITSTLSTMVVDWLPLDQSLPSMWWGFMIWVIDLLTIRFVNGGHVLIFSFFWRKIVSKSLTYNENCKSRHNLRFFVIESLSFTIKSFSAVIAKFQANFMIFRQLRALF